MDNVTEDLSPRLDKVEEGVTGPDGNQVPLKVSSLEWFPIKFSK